MWVGGRADETSVAAATFRRVTRSTTDARAEIRLYVEWMRGAIGRFAADDSPAAAEASPSAGPAAPGPASSASSVATARPGGVVAPPRSVGWGRPASPPPGGDQAGDSAAGQRIDPVAGGVFSRATTDAGFSGSAGALSDEEGASGDFDRFRAEVLGCRRCRLCESRTTVVFGEGARRPRLMVVGEAPGADEDREGRPFVGKAGQLLTRMLAAIGLAREDVFIANVLKCRPPGNRPPSPDEVLACRPFLREQIERLRPELLLLLGNHATRAVLSTDQGITRLRGRLMPSPEGWRTLPTFHPAYLLRNPDAKREAWADLRLAATTLGLPIPPRRPTPTDDATPPES